MAENYPLSLLDVQWDCPHCGARNWDNYEQTTRPLCSECDTSVDWSVIIPRENLRELGRWLHNYRVSRGLNCCAIKTLLE